MRKWPAIWDKLLTLRDEVSLHAHLMNMDLKSEWESLEKAYHALAKKLEHHALNGARELGEKEEHLWVGSDEEIRGLVQSFEDFKRRQQ